jgi:sulfonate transport system permease protein
MRLPALRRPSPLTAASLLLVLVVWHAAWLLAGDSKAGDPLVPGIPSILQAVKPLGNYWKGGLGVEATRAGGRLTWEAAILGLGYNVGLTAFRLLAGLALGIAVGVALAVVVSWSSLARRMFALPAHFARMLPLLAMVPLFSFWFGDTEHGSVLFVAFTAFVSVFAVGINAIANVPGYYARAAASMGASRARTYLSVVLPAALPELRSGVLLAVGFGWSAAITSEYLGQEYGLGHIVQNAEFFGRTQMLALVAVIALVLAAVTYTAAERTLGWLTRWSV